LANFKKLSHHSLQRTKEISQNIGRVSAPQSYGTQKSRGKLWKVKQSQFIYKLNNGRQIIVLLATDEDT